MFVLKVGGLESVNEDRITAAIDGYSKMFVSSCYNWEGSIMRLEWLAHTIVSDKNVSRGRKSTRNAGGSWSESG